MKNLFLKIPKTSPEIFYPVDSVGETLKSDNSVVYNFFTPGISSVLSLDASVRGVFLVDDDIWPLSFDEDDDSVSLNCRGESDYSFRIKADPGSDISLRHNGSDENLAIAQLTDFEGGDDHKLKFLYAAFHSKQQQNLISAICLRPYKEDELDDHNGLCGSFCVFKKDCEKDVTCNKCRWSKGLKCSR